MDVLSGLAGLFHGLSVAFEPSNLFYCLIGCLLGTMIGVLPGLGPLNAMAMLLPISYYLSPEGAIIMLAGIYYGSQYGGSTTSILVNMPGETSSIVTCLDGHQMAKNGRAGPALAIAALSSIFAGIIATLVIALLAPPLSKIALLFGPAEYVALMTLGLIVAVALANGAILPALGMVVFGLLLGSVGTDVVSGAYRMTMGLPGLSDGLQIVSVAMGLFGVGDIIARLEHNEPEVQIERKIERLWPSKDDFLRCFPAALRGTGLGCVLGLLPGGGAMLSSFAAYALEKNISAEPQRFGHGAPEGVAAPEAANNAGAQTSFIPLLTLGIPSNAVIALLAGAMLIQGITPGPNIIQEQPGMFWGLIASMFIGNIMLVIINLPLVGIWVKLLRVPYHLLYPAILAVICIGAYTMSNSVLDVFVLMIFGYLGYLFNKLRCEPAPLILAFVLAPIIEQNFRRALQVSYGDASIFVTQPISLFLLLVAVAVLGLLALPSIRKTREVAFDE